MATGTDKHWEVVFEIPGVTNGKIRCGHGHFGVDHRCAIGCVKSVKAMASKAGWTGLTARVQHMDSGLLESIKPMAPIDGAWATHVTMAQPEAWQEFLTKKPGGSTVSDPKPITSEPAVPADPTAKPKAKPKAGYSTPTPSGPDPLAPLRDMLLSSDIIEERAAAAAERKIAEAVESGAFQPPAIHVKVGSKETKVIEGLKHRDFEEVLTILTHDESPMLVGPSGCGKSFLAGQMAKALDVPLYTLSLSGGVTEGQLFGRLLPTGPGGAMEYSLSPFVEAYESGGLIFLDEMDSMDPNVGVSLNAALESGVCPVPNRIDDPSAFRHAKTYIMCAMNTFGRGADRMFVGRSAQDAATLDRFAVGTVEMDYDRDLEKRICGNTALLQRIWKIRDGVAEHKLRRTVSTRFIDRATKFLSSGAWDVGKAVEVLTRGWSEDERKLVGC